MSRDSWGRRVFAVGLIGCGAASVLLRNVLLYEGLPSYLPAKSLVALVTGVLAVGAGAGLLSPFKPAASRLALVLLFLWDLVATVPPVVHAPLDEGAWLELGMATMVVAGAWVLAGTSRLRAVRTVFGLALIPVGLSHFFFWQISLGLVPSWVPAPAFWVALVGVAHAAAGLGVLFGVVPRLAAALEAGQLTVFAFLVWLPRVIAKPSVQFNWTEMLGTLLIAGAAWVMADALA